MKKMVTILGITLLALVVCSMSSTAQARPNYLGVFKKTYPKVKDAATKKCAVCHPAKSKKVKNDFAKAVGKALPKKKCKDVKAIAEAYKKAEEAKNEDGVTFGELLKEGKLPK